MKKKLLLLIEDNPLLTGMYETAFEKEGFEVILAHDGKSGLLLAKDKKPDGILLDLLMPGMDGYGVLKELKKEVSTKNIKVIVLTVVADKAALERAEKAGAAECLIKSELKLSEIVDRAISYFSPDLKEDK